MDGYSIVKILAPRYSNNDRSASIARPPAHHPQRWRASVLPLALVAPPRHPRVPAVRLRSADASLRCRSSGRFRFSSRCQALTCAGSTRCRERPGPPVDRRHRQTSLFPQPPQDGRIAGAKRQRPPRPAHAVRRRGQLPKVLFAEFAFHDDSLLFCRRHRRRSVGNGRGSFAYSSGRGGRRDGSPAPLSSAHRTTPAPPQIIAFLSASSGRLCRPSLRSDVDLLCPLAR